MSGIRGGAEKRKSPVHEMPSLQAERSVVYI